MIDLQLQVIGAHNKHSHKVSRLWHTPEQTFSKKTADCRSAYSISIVSNSSGSTAVGGVDTHWATYHHCLNITDLFFSIVQRYTNTNQAIGYELSTDLKASSKEGLGNEINSVIN